MSSMLVLVKANLLYLLYHDLLEEDICSNVIVNSAQILWEPLEKQSFFYQTIILGKKKNMHIIYISKNFQLTWDVWLYLLDNGSCSLVSQWLKVHGCLKRMSTTCFVESLC